MSGKYPHRFEFDTLNSKSTSRSNIQQMVILVDYLAFWPLKAFMFLLKFSKPQTAYSTSKAFPM